VAVVLAQNGNRVLLVDLDLYHPAVGRLFERRRTPRVNEDLGLGHAILCDTATGVHLALLRGQVTQPAAFVSPASLRDYLDRALRAYDWVIVDSPPALGLNDARFIAQACDSTVLVAKWNETNREALQVAARDLQEYGAKIVGGVVNFVDLDKLAAHGHGLMDREGYYHKNARYYVERV
jgi:Mrp family chromosome partitioning ATPase